MKRLLLSLLLALACASPALAQTASPERLRAAGELIDAMNMRETMARNADATMKQQIEQAPMLAQYEDILRDFMDRATNWEEIRDDFVRAYAEIYTADELRQLRAFY